MQNRGALAPPSVDIPPELAAMSYDQILALLNAQQGALQAPGFNDGGDAGGDGGEGGEGEGGEGEGGDEGGGSESGDADEGGEGVAGDISDDDGQGGGGKGGQITGGEVLGGEIAAAEADIAAAAAAAAAAANAPGPAMGATAGAVADPVGVSGGLGALGNANATAPSSAFGADLGTMGALSGVSVSDLQNAQALGEMNTGRSAQQAALSSDLFGDFDLSVPATQQTVATEIPSELRGDFEVSVPATMAPAAPVAAPTAKSELGFIGDLIANSHVGKGFTAAKNGEYGKAAAELGFAAINGLNPVTGLFEAVVNYGVVPAIEAITGEKMSPTHAEGSHPGHPGHGDEAYPVDPGAGQGAFTPTPTDTATAQNWLNTWMQGTPGYQAAANGGALGYASGGKVPAGSHVIPADVVAAKGNGSSRAGALTYKPLGGRLVNGSGNGRSDSVPAKGPQGALRLSRDEVVVPPRGVRQAGGHGALSADSMQTRQKFQQHLGALPPPRR